MDTYTDAQEALKIQATALAGMMAGDTDARRSYDRANDLRRTGLPLCLTPEPSVTDLERNVARLRVAIRTEHRMAMRRDWCYDPIRHEQLIRLLKGEQALLDALMLARAA